MYKLNHRSSRRCLEIECGYGSVAGEAKPCSKGRGDLKLATVMAEVSIHGYALTIGHTVTLAVHCATVDGPANQ